MAASGGMESKLPPNLDYHCDLSTYNPKYSTQPNTDDHSHLSNGVSEHSPRRKRLNSAFLNERNSNPHTDSAFVDNEDISSRLRARRHSSSLKLNKPSPNSLPRRSNRISPKANQDNLSLAMEQFIKEEPQYSDYESHEDHTKKEKRPRLLRCQSTGTISTMSKSSSSPTLTSLSASSSPSPLPYFHTSGRFYGNHSRCSYACKNMGSRSSSTSRLDRWLGLGIYSKDDSSPKLNKKSSSHFRDSKCYCDQNKDLFKIPYQNGFYLPMNNTMSSKLSSDCSSQRSISPDVARSTTPPGLEADVEKANSGEVVCLWDTCGLKIRETDLLEHIRTKHVEAQVKKNSALDGSIEDIVYLCCWSGCKVYKQSCRSHNWLQRHVVLHGGDKPWRCIVSGCKQRFQSEGGLQRHINGHFNENSQQSSASAAPLPMWNGFIKPARPRDETPSKSTKRKKVKKEEKSFLMARIPEDFFDSNIMDGLRHRLWQLNDRKSGLDVTHPSNQITFRSSVIAKRNNCKNNILLHWFPENLLPDTWVSESQAKTLQSMILPYEHLPTEAQVKLRSLVHRQYRKRKQHRK